jgi:signal transduction histidine kinase
MLNHGCRIDDAASPNVSARLHNTVCHQLHARPELGEGGGNCSGVPHRHKAPACTFESTLHFGKAEERAPVLVPIDLAALATDVAEAEGLVANGDVALLIDVPTGMRVMADAEQLYRVLSNLIRNARQAIEATGAGGTIEISATETVDDWRIRVGDTGPGLPPKAREHLFEAFQGGARKGGTGLGLAIAAELIRGHGGRLDLARSDAEGTEFLIHLPKSTEQA